MCFDVRFKIVRRHSACASSVRWGCISVFQRHRGNRIFEYVKGFLHKDLAHSVLEAGEIPTMCWRPRRLVVQLSLSLNLRTRKQSQPEAGDGRNQQ